jgi:hypothetical protein
MPLFQMRSNGSQPFRQGFLQFSGIMRNQKTPATPVTAATVTHCRIVTINIRRGQHDMVCQFAQLIDPEIDTSMSRRYRGEISIMKTIRRTVGLIRIDIRSFRYGLQNAAIFRFGRDGGPHSTGDAQEQQSTDVTHPHEGNRRVPSLCGASRCVHGFRDDQHPPYRFLSLKKGQGFSADRIYFTFRTNRIHLAEEGNAVTTFATLQAPARMRLFLSGLVCFMIVALNFHAHADNPSNDTKRDRYRIHVITVGQGDDLFSRFGHIALMVEDRQADTETVYNFGTFDFDDPKLRLRYARGFLNYWLSTSRFDRFMRYNIATNRDVWIQTLSLSSEQTAEAVRLLEENARPENRYYAYRHYLDNCCTRIRDLLDEVTDGALQRQFRTEVVPRDFRYWTARSLEGLPLYRWVILYSLGPAIDQPITRWDEQFLPAVLFADLDSVLLPDGSGLVTRTTQAWRRTGPDIGATVPLLDRLVLGIIGFLLLLGLCAPAMLPASHRTVRLLGFGLTLWSLLAGLGGLMLVLYWTVTTHYDTHFNENLLITPVTHLWLAGPGITLLVKGRLPDRTRRLLYGYLLFSMGLIVLTTILKAGPFIQGNVAVIGVSALCTGFAILSAIRTGILPVPLPFRRGDHDA